MAFATLLPVSLQLDGLLMMWKFHQARQNDAIRAAFLWKRNYSLQRIHSGNLDEAFIWQNFPVRLPRSRLEKPRSR